MNKRFIYNTKQREKLLDYLKAKQDKHLTANDICLHFKNQNDSIGKSTIYRQLESLVDEGIINKYIIDGNSPACFEYNNEKKKADKNLCIHCKCEKCGKIIHVPYNEIKNLENKILMNSQFKLDPVRTVLYGLCDKCL